MRREGRKPKTINIEKCQDSRRRPIYTTTLEVVLGVLGISKRVGGAAIERIPLWLYISLRVGVLGGGEVSRGGIVWV